VLIVSITTTTKLCSYIYSCRSSAVESVYSSLELELSESLWSLLSAVLSTCMLTGRVMVWAREG